MSTLSRHHLLLRQLVVWVLACALPIQSMSTVLLQVLGSQHRHSVSSIATPSDTESRLSVRSIMRAMVGSGAMDIIDAYHAQTQKQTQYLAPVQRMSEQAHAHAHSMFQRHHHDPVDGSVIVIGEKETGQDAPGGTNGIDAVGILPLPAALALNPLALSAAMASNWPREAIAAWHSHVIKPLDKPPRG